MGFTSAAQDDDSEVSVEELADDQQVRKLILYTNQRSLVTVSFSSDSDLAMSREQAAAQAFTTQQFGSMAARQLASIAQSGKCVQNPCQEFGFRLFVRYLIVNLACLRRSTLRLPAAAARAGLLAFWQAAALPFSSRLRLVVARGSPGRHPIPANISRVLRTLARARGEPS